MAAWQRRLQKELMEIKRKPPPGMHLDSDSVSSNLATWVIHVDGAPGTLYDGEKFQLEFKFGSRYPFESPEVIFGGANIPVHPHVYSNGHICLSILTDDWSPALSVESVCLSIVSMLSSCQEKKLPPDNNWYVKTCNKNPKKTRWWYHDTMSARGIFSQGPRQHYTYRMQRQSPGSLPPTRVALSQTFENNSPGTQGYNFEDGVLV